jgi:hypothetical protein
MTSTPRARAHKERLLQARNATLSPARNQTARKSDARQDADYKGHSQKEEKSFWKTREKLPWYVMPRQSVARDELAPRRESEDILERPKMPISDCKLRERVANLEPRPQQNRGNPGDCDCDDSTNRKQRRLAGRPVSKQHFEP